jgi:hypothetical protein
MKYANDFPCEGRSIPPDPETFKQGILNTEKRKEQEETQQRENPERFISYEDNPPQTPKEVIRLFKRYPRIVECGHVYAIRSVRETKRKGVVLDLQQDEPDGSWIRFNVPEADWLLRQGEIVLDNERRTWVRKDQQRMPEKILDSFGLAAWS